MPWVASPGGGSLRYLRPHAAPFSVAIVGLLIGSGLGLLVPLVIAGLVTQVVAGGDSAGLDRLIVGLVFLFLAQSLGGLVQSYYLGVVGERIVAQLRGELFASLVSLSLDFHGRHRVGELVSRLSSDVTLIRTMLTQTTTSLLSSLIGLIGSVIILFTLSPTLLLVALLLAPALLAVAIIFGRPLQRVSTQVQDSIAHSTGDRRGGAGRHPGRQELRPRGLRERALRRATSRASSRRARGSRCGGRCSARSWASSASGPSPCCCGTRATRSSTGGCRSGR